jgi:hypothetical protein
MQRSFCGPVWRRHRAVLGSRSVTFHHELIRRRAGQTIFHALDPDTLFLNFSPAEPSWRRRMRIVRCGAEDLREGQRLAQKDEGQGRAERRHQMHEMPGACQPEVGHAM